MLVGPHWGHCVQAQRSFIFWFSFGHLDDLLLLGLEAFLQVSVLWFLGLWLVSLNLVSWEPLVDFGCLQIVDMFQENPLSLFVLFCLTQSSCPSGSISVICYPYSSIGSTLPFPYAHLPALPTRQDVFPASSLGMLKTSSFLLGSNQTLFLPK